MAGVLKRFAISAAVASGCCLAVCIVAGIGRGDAPAQPEPVVLPPYDEESRQDVYARFLVVREQVLEPIELSAGQEQRSLVSSAEAPDSEWQRLPRGRDPRLPDDIMDGSPYSWGSESLYRHLLLNPDDVYLEPRTRMEFGVLVQKRKLRIERVFDLYNEAVTAEMLRLIHAGAKSPLAFNNSPATLAYLKRRSAPNEVVAERWLYERGDEIITFFGIGNTLYGFFAEDAPQIAEISELLDYLREELAGCVCNWFVAHQLMSAPASAEYRRRMSVLATTKRGVLAPALK